MSAIFASVRFARMRAGINNPSPRRSSVSSAMPAAMQARGDRSADHASVDGDFAADGRIQSEKNPSHFGSPRPHEPGDPDDFAGADREIEIGDDARLRQSANLEHRRRGAGPQTSLGKEIRERATEHGFDHMRNGEASGGDVLHHDAVPQDDHLVTQPENVRQDMADVDGGDPTPLRRAMRSNRRLASRVVSDVVGSSKMMILMSTDNALAISTSCRSPWASRLTGVSTSMSRPTSAKQLSRPLLHAAPIDLRQPAEGFREGPQRNVLGDGQVLEQI